jgi:DNA-binding transcriptional MerR regulator
LLRYYDQIGLLKPVHTDADTGYRYYTAEQLPRLNRILALKDLGLSLDQIGRLLRDDVSADEIRGMLTIKKAQIEQTVRDEIARLQNVELRLAQIEQEGEMWQHDVVLKTIPSQPYLSLRAQGKSEDEWMRLFNRVRYALPTGESEKLYGYMAFVLHSDIVEEDDIDLELGYLLNHRSHAPVPLADGQTMTVRELPGADTMATIVHKGWGTGVIGYNALGAWIEANHFQIVGPGREIMLQIGDQVEQFIIEIQFPVEKASSPTNLFHDR